MVESTTQRNTCQVQNISDFFYFNDKERLMKSLILSSLSKSQHQKEQMVGKVAKGWCSQLCSCFDRISTIVSTAFLWFVATAFLPFFWPHLCVIISLFFYSQLNTCLDSISQMLASVQRLTAILHTAIIFTLLFFSEMVLNVLTAFLRSAIISTFLSDRCKM